MSGVVVEGVSKTYRGARTPALVDVSFVVQPGELFGLIGPDGAGKTSLIRILATLVLADHGTASVGGHDVVSDYAAIRRIVGYMPGRFSLYQDLSVIENLRFFATVFGTTVEANYHLVSDIYVQLEPFEHRPAGKLSGGMKQKLALCCAMIHEPKVLFLDEPTTGVDPVSRTEFWDMLGRLRARGITIIVSTPYMDEAARCERIAMIQHGRIIALDTVPAILANHATPTYAVRGAQPLRVLQALRAYPLTDHCFAFGREQHLVLKPAAGSDDTQILAGVRTYLRDHGHAGAEVLRISPTIEDVFIHLTNERDHG